MKKLLFILLAVVLFSCEKDERYCFDCRRDIFTPEGNYSVMIEACDQTEAGIKAFEQTHTFIEGTKTVTMKCWKKGDEPKI